MADSGARGSQDQIKQLAGIDYKISLMRNGEEYTFSLIKLIILILLVISKLNLFKHIIFVKLFFGANFFELVGPNKTTIGIFALSLIHI